MSDRFKKLENNLSLQSNIKFERKVKVKVKENQSTKLNDELEQILVTEKPMKKN
jgi:hypothetical protein